MTRSRRAITALVLVGFMVVSAFGAGVTSVGDFGAGASGDVAAAGVADNANFAATEPTRQEQATPPESVCSGDFVKFDTGDVNEGATVDGITLVETNTTDGEVIGVDFNGTQSVGSVYVSGGGETNVYNYSTTKTEDTGLFSPVNENSGKHYEISNIVFCLAQQGDEEQDEEQPEDDDEQQDDQEDEQQDKDDQQDEDQQQPDDEQDKEQQDDDEQEEGDEQPDDEQNKEQEDADEQQDEEQHNDEQQEDDQQDEDQKQEEDEQKAGGSDEPAAPEMDAYQVDLVFGEPIEDIGEDENAFYGRQGRLIQAVSFLEDGEYTDTFRTPGEGETAESAPGDCTVEYSAVEYDADSGEVTADVTLPADAKCDSVTVTLAAYELPDGTVEFQRDRADEQELVASRTIDLSPGDSRTLEIDVDD